MVLDTSGYKQAITNAQKQTTGAGQAAGKASKGFGNLEGQAKKTGKGFAGLGKSLSQVGPKVGGVGLNFAALANPMGLATAAAGAFAAAIIGSVTKVTALEKELRPMVERSRIGAESLQILAEAAKRAGSEDGLEGVTDSSQELQLQLGELAILGSGRAKEALEALGLSAKELNDLEPEAAWRRTVEAIQQVPDVTARAALAEEVFGGTSEKLAGIVNMTAGEFAELEKNVAATADVVSEQDLAERQSVDPEYGQPEGVHR